MPEPKQVDSLTGLFLRESFRPFLEQLMLDSRRDNTDFSIAYIDVDRFKKYNDKFGHSFGDKVLEYVAKTLLSSFKECRCQFFRYGGDEFIIVFIDKGPKDAYHAVRDCILNFRKYPFLFKDKCHNITISCGIASYLVDGPVFEELIQKADKAMYFSKNHGRNLITLASRIGYLRFRDIFVLMFVACAVIWYMFFLHQTTLKMKSEIEKILDERIIKKPTVEGERIIKKPTVEGERVITEPRDLTVIVLNDGKRLEGRIIKETEDRIEFSLNLPEGKIVTNLDKSKIARIERY